MFTGQSGIITDQDQYSSTEHYGYYEGDGSNPTDYQAMNNNESVRELRENRYR